MARLEKTPTNPHGARQVDFDSSEPALVALVALGPHFQLRDLSAALKKARIGSTDALSLVDQAVEADLLFSDPEAIHWQRDQLHQASVRLAEHPLLPTLAGVDQLKSFYAPLDLRFNLARLAVYLNDEALFERCYVGMNYLLPYFRSAEASWVATRRPGLARLLDGFLGCELFYRVDLSPEWQQRLSGTDEWAFAIAVLQGDLQTASRCFLHPGCAEALDFLRGDAEKAHQGFQKLIKRRKKGPVLHSFPALFAQLAALHCGDAMAAMDERYTSSYFPGLQELFQTAARQMLAPHSEKTYELDSTGSLATLFSLVLKPLLVGGQIKAAAVEKARQRWKGQGLHGLLRQLEQPVSTLHWGHGLGRREDWEIWLSALRNRGQVNELPASKAAKATATLRLVWHLDEGTPRPAKEKLNREAWTASTIAWKTLMNKTPDFLSEQDRVVLGKVRRSKDYGGEYFSFGLDSYRALIGHPHLYHKGKPCQLELVPLQLKVRRQGQSLRVETVPALRPGQDFAVYPLGPGKMGLCEVTSSQQALLSLTEQKVDIPLKAQEQLLESLTPWMDKVDLQLPAEVVPEQPGQSQVVVRIQPLGVGLRFELGVRPGGEAGPFCPAGEGPLTLTLKQENRTILVRRDFPQEVAEREKLWRRCQTLQEQVQVEAPDVREALEILLELQGSGVRLEWPAQKPWRLKALDRKQGLALQALQDGDWFEIRGQVKVDESLQLEVQRLLELTRSAQGRFIALADGQFLALTTEMKQRLLALDDLVEVHKKKVRLSRLAVSTLAELGVEGDAAFQSTLEQFQQAENYTARLPGALQAELRDYQLEGYRWMARRARAGAGCCLADDMGLGKTLQALALLVKEAKQGPHLVVCPTSVCGNWVAQIARFAPTLEVVTLEGKHRAQQLAGLQAGSVALCSYRILLQDQEHLQKVEWNAVVLDEAQFIKNPDSKTARAAFSLCSRIRLATTGTPIENRLLELWSIFNFLNPGLLGSLSSFQKRFETPSLSGQAAPRQRLRRLVAPFLLRRTKSQVLEELPERTDISLEVELSPKERALYEALRQQAVESAGQEQGHLQLLAHLTRLRQACCHPQLVQSEPLASSKFETFLQLAEELREGRHRALVFSQFVELLQLLRQELDQRGWSYLYLDGSTPAGQRPKLVDEFQEGETDFFLISLKAGGTGLNLTAADYVVHLDPWWNPAAEDQASDRAHRIGQTRPVTVYRLVAKDTLEERVLQLHAHKRQLAQQVLEGSDANLRLNAQELMELLHQ